MLTETAIEATGVTKSYDHAPVLNGIDLSVTRGSVFALLGPNGAGKTTTVKILATLASPDSGRAAVAGYDVVAQRHEVRSRISLTGQYAALDDLQTGLENLEMMAALSHLPRRSARARARQLLAQFDLLDAGSRRVGSYSGGMRRRLDLAASLVAEPQVLFLDEPTTGLDPRSRQVMWALVGDLTDAGVTVFLTTQYLEEADQLADRVAVVDHGEIVAEGSSTELKRKLGGQRLELRMTDDHSFAGITRDLGARIMRSDRATLSVVIATDGVAREVRALLDELDPEHTRIASFEVHTATLDDVFMTLTAGHTATESEAAGV